MSLPPSGFEKQDLWKILIDAAHALPMYKNHKHYVEDVMIKEKPEISPQELAVQLNIPLGEALVILAEIVGAKTTKAVGSGAANVGKSSDRSLLDFGGSSGA